MSNVGGQTFYEILQVIDEGGQATIRLLRERGTSVIRVGKFLREYWDPLARAAFGHEAFRQARVAGPGIVPVLGWNLEIEQPFIVLEFMPGGSLAKELARRGRLGRVEALRMAREIAVRLVDLHDQGVVHRDLKPGNVLRAVDGRLVLSDLGLAATMSLAECVTSHGFLGTPSYAAPEQSFGIATPASDVFALGVMLNEFVTGSTVRAGSRPLAIVEPLVSALTKANPSARPSSRQAFHLLDQAMRRAEAIEAEQRRVGRQVLGTALAAGLLLAFANSARS